MRVGGHVEWLLEPSHPDQLVVAWNLARGRGLRPRILGGGANLIVEDGEHPGVVFATERLSRVFRPHPDVSDASVEEGGRDVYDPVLPQVDAFDGDADPRLVAWAGARLPGLVRAAQQLGWRGLEGLVGVPGQLGGAVSMNAGGRWGEIWDVIESVRLLLPDGSLVQRERGECEPRYRNGNLEGAVLLGAVLRLEPEDPQTIRDRMRSYLADKHAAQPLTERSSGCIFRNPDPELSDGRTAGKLLDECGAKEHSRGTARVSPKHANFIVNRGDARASDVIDLMALMRGCVADRTGIELEREVEIWPAGESSS